MTLIDVIESGAKQLTDAGVAFGHGTTNAFDEAAWLVLWQLGLPLDSPLDGPDTIENRPLAPAEYAQIASLFIARIESRKPAAYLTKEAWLQGVPFYVDERTIVPRSLIAEVLANGAIDPWLSDATRAALDLCTGNGSLAILTAMTYPDVQVDASDVSADALAVARINVDKHQLQSRVSLLTSDGLASVRGPYDLIVCNPPYVNSKSMAALPAEFKAEPELALAGGTDGMDFIHRLLSEAALHMTPQAVLVLEIGNEKHNFDTAFPTLEVVWLDTSAGDEQVLLVTREELASHFPKPENR